MNRESKFKGKRVDNGEWVYGYYRKITRYDKFVAPIKELYTKHFIGVFDNLILFEGVFEQVEVIPETVGQFNSRYNFYEGDLVLLSTEIGFDNGHTNFEEGFKNLKAEVVLTDLGWEFKLDNNETILFYAAEDNEVDVKLIGNIHDKETSI